MIRQIYNQPMSKNVGKMGLTPSSKVPFYITSTTSTREVIKHLCSVFYCYSVPDHWLPDHGRAFQFTKFKRFLPLHGIQQHFSVSKLLLVLGWQRETMLHLSNSPLWEKKLCCFDCHEHRPQCKFIILTILTAPQLDSKQLTDFTIQETEHSK